MVGLKEDNGKECKMIDFRLIREKVLTYVCVLIPLIGFVLFSLVPMIISFVMQFTKMEGFDLATMQWNFFENFLFVFTDKTFYLSIGVTLVLALSQLISLCIALFVSVAISKKPYGYKTFQVIFFVPYICSSEIFCFGGTAVSFCAICVIFPFSRIDCLCRLYSDALSVRPRLWRVSGRGHPNGTAL